MAGNKLLILEGLERAFYDLCDLLHAFIHLCVRVIHSAEKEFLPCVALLCVSVLLSKTLFKTEEMTQYSWRELMT